MATGARSVGLGLLVVVDCRRSDFANLIVFIRSMVANICSQCCSLSRSSSLPWWKAEEKRRRQRSSHRLPGLSLRGGPGWASSPLTRHSLPLRATFRMTQYSSSHPERHNTACSGRVLLILSLMPDLGRGRSDNHDTKKSIATDLLNRATHHDSAQRCARWCASSCRLSICLKLCPL